MLTCRSASVQFVVAASRITEAARMIISSIRRARGCHSITTILPYGEHMLTRFLGGIASRGLYRLNQHHGYSAAALNFVRVHRSDNSWNHERWRLYPI
jgi:hypothetical protein